MRVSICLVSSPRQYAPATELSLNALIRPVEGPWGPRHRSRNGPFRYSETVSTPSLALQVLDQLDLVWLALGAEALDRLIRGDLGPFEGLVRLDVGPHRLLDPLEVGLRRD